MCEIYSNASLVISADASPSSNFGILPGRDHVNKEWKNIGVIHPPDNHHITASVRIHKENSFISYNGIAWGGVRSPLLNRGWAFQERLLANRLLRFTNHGIVWECNNMHNTRLGLMSKTIRLAKLARIEPGLQKFTATTTTETADEGNWGRQILNFLGQNTPASIYLAWQDIVTSYCGMELTRTADKLSALSGLARLVSEALPVKHDAYLAGHWRDDLVGSLLWYTTVPKTPNRSLPYRAPTWS
jgi:hypothetical protein